MIYTITLNPAIDKTVYIDSLKKKKSFVEMKFKDPAGKGINVSKTLFNLSIDSCIITILAGESGKYIQKELESTHKLVFETVIGTTRTNTKIIDQHNGNVYELNETGPSFDKILVFELIEKIDIKREDIFVLSGSVPLSVPSSIYKELIRKIKLLGAFVILDASGQLLTEGVKGLPDVIKPNKEELEFLMNTEYSTIEEIVKDKDKILLLGSKVVIVTLADLGSLYISSEVTYLIKNVKTVVRSTVGAGDAFLSGYVFGLHSGDTIKNCLKMATAVATASVETLSTCSPTKKRVDELLKRVEISKIQVEKLKTI